MRERRKRKKKGMLLSSVWSSLLFFFLFFFFLLKFLFDKLPHERFFLGGFQCNYMCNFFFTFSRALFYRLTLYSREREGKRYIMSSSASSEESAGGGSYGGGVSSPQTSTPYYSHQSHILQHQVGVDFLSSFQLQQTQQNAQQREQPST